MEVVLAKSLGLCFGVDRSVKIAEKAVSEKKDVSVLGQIVHNPQLIEKLKKFGAKTADSIDEIAGGVVLVRAHGIPPKLLEQLKAKVGAENVIDATCPLVNVVQNYAKKLFDEGYNVIIIGEKTHPEAIGINGFAGDSAQIISSIEEAQAMPFQSKKVGVVVQTTLEPDEVSKIISELFLKTHELRIFNTICNPTKERQPAAQQLAKQVGIVIVVGGKNSSNTMRLREVCEKAGAKAYHVEYTSDIKKEWLKNPDGSFVKEVGLTAGASTPDFVIKEFEEFLKNIDKK